MQGERWGVQKWVRYGLLLGLMLSELYVKAGLDSNHVVISPVGVVQLGNRVREVPKI